MRNVLLAAVSAVAVLSVSPEANAVAATKTVMVGSHHLVLNPYTYEGANYWWAPYGNYWVVGSHMAVPNAKVWKTIDVDGKPVYFYGVSVDPHSGLLALPFANWVGYPHFVAAHTMDAVLDDAVKAPYLKSSEAQTIVK